jgi:hypothetical protein
MERRSLVLLFLCLFAVHVAGLTERRMREVLNLVDELEEAGMNLSGVEIREKYGGLGLYATKYFPPGSDLLQVPSSFVFTTHAISPDSPQFQTNDSLIDHAPRAVADAIRGISQPGALVSGKAALNVLFHLNLGKKSHFHSLFASFPEAEELDTPPFYTDEELSFANKYNFNNGF